MDAEHASHVRRFDHALLLEAYLAEYGESPPPESCFEIQHSPTTYGICFELELSSPTAHTSCFELEHSSPTAHGSWRLPEASLAEPWVTPPPDSCPGLELGTPPDSCFELEPHDCPQPGGAWSPGFLRGLDRLDDSDPDGPPPPPQPPTSGIFTADAGPAPSQAPDASDGPDGPPPPGKPRGGRRGAHVRARPDMPARARAAIPHWAESARRMRADWEGRAAARPDFRDRFAEQAREARGAGGGGRTESLLLYLQAAADEGLVRPCPAGGPAAGASESFFGWAGFAVVPEAAARFREGLEGLFPAGHQAKTVQAALMGAGLAPGRMGAGPTPAGPARTRWREAWGGVPGAAFVYRRPGGKGGA